MTCRYCAPDGHDPITPVVESWKARVAELEAELARLRTALRTLGSPEVCDDPKCCPIPPAGMA